MITGRGAPERLIEVADLVTEMREIKHPFQSGVMAQIGIPSFESARPARDCVQRR